MCQTVWMLARVLGMSRRAGAAVVSPVVTLVVALAGTVASLAPSIAAAAEDPAPLLWPQWQGRLSLVTSTDPWRLGVEGPLSRLSSATLMGDYYFGRSEGGPGRVGGLRATSGLIFGPRAALGTGASLPSHGSAFTVGSRSTGRAPAASLADNLENTTAPYLGIGYTGLSSRGGWGVSADLGLIGKGSSNTSRATGPSLDDLVHELRMAPLLQLGVSYTF